MQEFLNGGFQMKLLIPVEDHDYLSQKVGQGVNITIDNYLFIVAVLEKVSTTTIKDKISKESNIYNQVVLQVERIMIKGESEKLLLTMPDKKEYIRHTIELHY